ncbi:unnamed protein product, partial [Pleuronectes platessa]
LAVSHAYNDPNTPIVRSTLYGQARRVPLGKSAQWDPCRPLATTPGYGERTICLQFHERCGPAHIPDTDTCTEDAQDTAMVIIPAQAQLDDRESSDVSNAYDNGSNMQGKHQGVQRRVLDTNKKALWECRVDSVKALRYQMPQFVAALEALIDHAMAKRPTDSETVSKCEALLKDIQTWSFLSVLGEVQLAIKAFEGEEVDPLKLLDSLGSLIKSVSSRVLNPLANIDVLKEPMHGYINLKPYLGYLCESKAAELHLAPEEKNYVRKRCVAFTISLTNDLRPHSNAGVERLFSQMSVVKSKLRNRMSLQTLKSILCVGYGLKLS